MRLVNARTDETIAHEVVLACTRAARRRGLLGRDSLDPSAALVLSPCWAIHTMFMRFAIDVIFIDREGGAVRIVRELAPWRMAAARGAHAAIELRAGRVQTLGVRLGDRLRLADTAASLAGT